MTRFRPLDVVHVHLEDGLEKLRDHALSSQHDVYAVFWHHGIPLGDAELARGQAESAMPLAHKVAQRIAPAVGDRLFAHGFRAVPWGMSLEDDPAPDLSALVEVERPLAQIGPGSAAPVESDSPADVSVIVCTRNRPDELERCLRSLLQSRVRPREIIVVDNDPAAPATRAVVESLPGVTYVAEAAQGLSRARNAGLLHARGGVISFTDDDTVVHPEWIARLVEGFDEPEVMCVTGLVLPAELETPAQVAFEKAIGGFSQGYRRLTFDSSFFNHFRSYGVPAWRVGAGANMAIRRSAFDICGNFDERLGAGAAGCSEDSEFWYRLLAEGWTCRYRPEAVVFHYHRRDLRALRSQARAYIRGHLAALFAQYARYGDRGNLRRAFVTMPYWLGRKALREMIMRNRSFPVLGSYLAGYVAGLRFLPLAIGDERVVGSGRKAARTRFLRRNPYPHRLSEGLFYREKMRAIHMIAPEGPFRRILEIGGGQSGLAAELYPGAEIVTVDLDANYAYSPLNQKTGTRFVCADATKLPFEADSFDLVTLFDLLEHVPQDDHAADEAIRVVRPGGTILVTSPNEHWRFPYYAFMRWICPSEDEIMHEWGHVRRGYSIAALRQLFNTAPIKIANYITPLTAVGHDLAFSKLSQRARVRACALVSPLTWLGYALHRPRRFGVERGTSWQPDKG